MNNLGLILLVDDNPDDYEATHRSLRKNHFKNPVKWCKSGQDAKDFLYYEGEYSDQQYDLPILILLDLNMPGLDGRQLLKLLKVDEKRKGIPTVILTTSNDPTDVDSCYNFGASTYIQKPVEFDGLIKAIKTIKDYWFGIAILPGQKHPSEPVDL